jgi:hypothetical protein
MTSLRQTSLQLCAIPLAIGLLGGCVYSKETVTEKAVPVVAGVSTPSGRVVTHPEGRYQLYGDGTTTPYYWVWIPSGMTSPAPPPPPPPVPSR